MGKSIISITMDTELINKMRENHLNISKTCNIAIKEFFERELNPKQKLYSKFNQLQEEFKEYGLTLEGVIK